MAIVIKNTNYNGEVLERLFTQAVLGCQIVDKGLICVIPNVTKKLAIPRLKTGKMLQKSKEMPDQRDSKGGWNYSEHVLEPEEFMAFTTFNPNTLYNIWRPWQPTGNLVFTELPPNVQNALLDALSKQVQFELGWHYINGTFGNSDEELFNGILYRMEHDGDVKRISTAATTMIGKLYAVKAAIPETIKEHPNLRYLMSMADWEQYDQELTDREHKNSDETALNRKMFKGVKIETLAGWPNGLIVATLCSPDESGNLFAGVNLPSDEDVIQIDKLTNAGELYFFKMKLEIDTNIAFGEEVIVLDTRATKQFPVVSKTLTLSDDSVEFTAAGGTDEVTVTATGDYHIVGKTPKGFNVKDLGGKLAIEAKPNRGTSDVTGTVTLALDSDPSVTATLTLKTSVASGIVNEAAPEPTISGASMVNVPATSGDTVRTYATSNGAAVTATTDAGWLDLSVTGNQVTFTREAYAYDAEGEATRSATVTIGIVGSTVTKTVTVTQAMASEA